MTPVQRYTLLNDDEFRNCFLSSNSRTEFYQKLGYSSSKAVKPHVRIGINERIVKLGLDEKQLKFKPKRKKKINHCMDCGKETFNACYCSTQCQQEHYKKEKIKLWKETGNTGCGVSTTLRNCIRDYILKNQEYKCAICGLECNWNGKPLTFILDHIDGNASNNYENNLRLICPNCDSQLDTYKSKNKNSARTFRKYGSVAESGLLHLT